jgi:hypothetical protein
VDQMQRINRGQTDRQLLLATTNVTNPPKSRHYRYNR